LLQHSENASITASYRFRPTVFTTLLTMVAVGVFASLAVWQYQRALYKEQVAQAVAQQTVLPAMDLNQTGVDWPFQRFRPATVTGTWEAGSIVLLDNIVHHGKAGYHVITPLRLSNGQRLLVNRGWVEVGSDRQKLPTVSTPGGVVQLNGTLDLPRSKPVFLFGDIAADVEGNQRWLYLDVARFGQILGATLPPYLLLQTSDTADGLRRDWPDHENKAGMHIGYSIQWAAFALMVLASWLYLNTRKKENA
jgi:surfeit locus 1 family protein